MSTRPDVAAIFNIKLRWRLQKQIKKLFLYKNKKKMWYAYFRFLISTSHKNKQLLSYLKTILVNKKEKEEKTVLYSWHRPVSGVKKKKK